MAVLAVVGVGVFFLTRDDDDGQITSPDDGTLPVLPSTPDLTLPDISLPDFTVPTIPDISLPDFTLPSLPDFSIPDFSIPDFSIPDFTLPDISIPDFSIPDFSIPTGGSIPPPTEEPDGLGDDPVLDALAQQCYDGEMQACDDLYDDSEAGSEYERYGDTCAGRQDERTLVYCRVSFPG